MTELDMALSAPWDTGDFVHAPAGREARRRAFALARRHSRGVVLLRVLLPVGGLLAVAGFLVKAHFGFPGDFDLAAASLSVTKNSIIMDHPHLTGFGGDKRGYSLSADRAIQPLNAPGQVRLEEIIAKVTGTNQGETSITAEAGDYDHEKNTLQLLGAIAVDSAEGYRLRMTDAQVDFGANTMVTDHPISIGYGDSKITGERMSISNGGKTIVIEGNVHTTVMPPKRTLSPSAPAAE
jgi:lipopolysaccharide export system protein LptC